MHHRWAVIWFAALLLSFGSGLYIVACEHEDQPPLSEGKDNSNCGGGLEVTYLRNWNKQPAVVALAFSVETCQGEPVTDLTNADIKISDEGELISAAGSRQSLVPAAQGYQFVTLLLLDLSRGAEEDLNSLQAGARAFVAAMPEGQAFALYGFRGDEHILRLLDFTADKNALSAAIGALGGYLQAADANLYGAFVEGLAVLGDQAMNAKLGHAAFHGSLVVFAAGTDRAKLVDKNAALSEVRASPHAVFTVGVGGEIDAGELEDFGKNGFAKADDYTGLATAFQDAAAAVQTVTGKYYLVAYCSAERSGSRAVTVRVTRGDQWGAFDAGYNAYGFYDGCGNSDIDGFAPGGADDDTATDDDTAADDDTTPIDTGTVWSDATTGLTWQDESSAQADWNGARDYCDNLAWGGYDDWRLPTISELRGLIRGCDHTMPGGLCGVTDTCLDAACWAFFCYGCDGYGGPGPAGMYWPPEISGEGYWYWSASAVADQPTNAWYVDFFRGKIFQNYIYSTSLYVRCVRP